MSREADSELVERTCTVQEKRLESEKFHLQTSFVVSQGMHEHLDHFVQECMYSRQNLQMESSSYFKEAKLQR